MMSIVAAETRKIKGPNCVMAEMILARRIKLAGRERERTMLRHTMLHWMVNWCTNEASRMEGAGLARTNPARRGLFVRFSKWGKVRAVVLWPWNCSKKAEF